MRLRAPQGYALPHLSGVVTVASRLATVTGDPEDHIVKLTSRHSIASGKNSHRRTIAHARYAEEGVPFSQHDVDRFFFGVAQQLTIAFLAANSAVLVTAKGRCGIVGRDTIDPDIS